jgi:ABC-2 type transport system permease protein
MWAIAVKELRQLRRDHRMLALMIVMPLLLLLVFGYAASFDVTDVRTLVVGPAAERASGQLPDTFDVVGVRPADTRAAAEEALRDGEAMVAVVADPAAPAALVDGSQLFAARAALAAFSQAAARRAAPPGGVAPEVEVLFNPELKTSVVMVPGLMGLVLVFVGTVITSLGVVKERQAGTLEQLAVMPFRPRDVIAGKVLPYFAVAAFDMTLIVLAGLWLFDIPFRGSVLTFALAAALFLLVTLGVGVLISTVSENQGQAVMLAIMTLLPQFLLSGLIFPVEAMAAGVRWLAYVLPLKYFIEISRGVLIRGTPAGALLLPLGMLAVLGLAVFSLAVLRFRHDLAPRGGRVQPGEPERPLAEAGA